ncbi:uncharacterized protein AMSG_04974 [Thecamonas trahens ATCC 50062]|uniref:Uncharacterized protein n=1 Tax=Thecamonas trahens ATCC 50062 TaxID=461836 RepID=A0A0L0D8F9_THETB|nr:hypothetical protein AMSG_04974 [Thecamonas trahens ATCC 50062]KNC48530.1 hypothetical protein AMSG_04974 [Thecamonas trahens ATCC 50062]|eukprot:XP_013758638.1 hypothetical protein AMSG_04974 [Thecamonas trahens ATCC 50062]
MPRLRHAVGDEGKALASPPRKPPVLASPSRTKTAPVAPPSRKKTPAGRAREESAEEAPSAGIYVVNRQAAYAFVNELIDEFLEDEIVPDLLIDVLSQPDAEFEVGSEQTRVEAWLVDEVVALVVPALAKQVALECTDELVKHYFINKAAALPDPHEVIVGDVIEAYVVAEAAAVVDEAVAELVTELLTESRVSDAADAIIDEVVAPMLGDIVRAAILDNAVDGVGAELYDEQLAAFIELVAEEEYAAAQGLEMASGQRLEFLQVSDVASSKLLDELIISHLLNVIGDGAEMALVDEYLDRTLNQMMARTLLVRTADIVDAREEVTDNVFLATVHDMLTTDMAIAFVVDRMKALVPSAAAVQFEREAAAMEARAGRDGSSTRRAELDRNARMSELRRWLSRNNYDTPSTPSTHDGRAKMVADAEAASQMLAVAHTLALSTGSSGLQREPPPHPHALPRPEHETVVEIEADELDELENGEIEYKPSRYPSPS